MADDPTARTQPTEVPRLLVLRLSPWSERVRWALDHHGVAHRVQEHVPFLGERRLRRLVGPGKRATVPVLVHGERVLTESWDIARYADEVGGGAPLFPADRDAEVRHWAQRADGSARGGRALVAAALLRSPGALDESLPPQVPRWLRPLLRPVARYGAQWFSRKHDLSGSDLEGPERALCEGLDAMEAALASGESEYLLGTFSYADIVMATLLQAILPVEDRYLRLGPAMREVWTQPHLATRYQDLVRWRDDLYARHRAG